MSQGATKSFENQFRAVDPSWAGLSEGDAEVCGDWSVLAFVMTPARGAPRCAGEGDAHVTAPLLFACAKCASFQGRLNYTTLQACQFGLLRFGDSRLP